MNQFDKKQTNILKPLLEHGVILHFSFYANTFPIAYHYTLLLEQHNYQNPNNSKDISKYIKPHNWNEVFPSKSNSDLYSIRKRLADTSNWNYPESIHLFYASDINFKTKNFKKDNPITLIEKTETIIDTKEKIGSIIFSEYLPRFVFLNNNLYTQRLVTPEKEEKFNIDSIEFKEIENIKSQYYTLTNILKKAKFDNVERLRVYTETINEAKDIFEDYSDWKDKVSYYDERKIDSLELDDSSKNESKSLDIYFYGAPTSFLFLNRKKRFIPVLLDKAKIAIKTMAVIHSNPQKHTTEKISPIENAIKEYHKELYRTANSSEGEEFLNNIRLAYNKYAKLIRSDSYFFTPQSFANCITLHHKYETVEEQNFKKQTDKLVANENETSKNIHIHYGAGRLGIGLVLPLMKPNSESNNQLVVIQKIRKGSEWNNIDTSTNNIELSNSNEWKLNFQFKKLIEKNEKFTIEDNNDYFLLFENINQIENVLKTATSISYSLNDLDTEKEFLEYLQSIKFSKQVLLFPFENNPYGSNKCGSKENHELLFSNESKIKYVNVKADRICSDRVFTSNNKVEVSCEKYIEVVLNIDEKSTNLLFQVNSIKQKKVLFIPDKIQYSFLAKRKQYLVNELHFILVVYGYEFLISKGITNWENQYVTIIQSALTSEYKYKIPIDTFIRLQIIRLFHLSEFLNKSKNNYDWSILKGVYELEEDSVDLIYESLVKYAKVTTDRFSASQEDLMTRIFNTSKPDVIKRKYNDIVKEIENFINDINNRSSIENLEISLAGTYLEYKYLIDNIKEKIQKIFDEKKKSFDKEVESKEREHKEKKEELGKFVNMITTLIKK